MARRMATKEKPVPAELPPGSIEKKSINQVPLTNPGVETDIDFIRSEFERYTLLACQGYAAAVTQTTTQLSAGLALDRVKLEQLNMLGQNCSQLVKLLKDAQPHAYAAEEIISQEPNDDQDCNTP